MKKQTYLEPAVQVLSLAPIQETMTKSSITLGILPTVVMGTDFGAPSDLSSEDYDDIFTSF